MAHGQREMIVGFDIVPEHGSPRWNSLDADQQWDWDALAAMRCMICDQLIGHGCWVVWWGPALNAHLACHEEARQRDLNMVNNPWLIEQAAKASEMTLDGFRALPIWERERRVRAVSNSK